MYFSQSMPFVISRMVSGPDYHSGQRWRRTQPDAPWVSPRAFAAGFARRAEASCRTDWMATSIVRSVAFKHTAEHTMASLGGFQGKRNAATATSATEYVKAAQKLCHHLHNGFTGKGLPTSHYNLHVPLATDNACEGRTAAGSFFSGGNAMRRRARKICLPHLPGRSIFLALRLVGLPPEKKTEHAIFARSHCQ